MSDTTTLSDAISALQEAQTSLVQATDTIENHNVDEQAHADIRQAILNLTESENIYTRSEIKALIHEQIKDHLDADFKTAHSGWVEYETALEERLVKLESRITAIENRINAEDDKDDEDSELAKKIQAIEDKYAVILDNLQSAYSEAVANDQIELAAQYKQAIAKTLDEKKAEILALLQGESDDHVATITFAIDNATLVGAVGEMVNLGISVNSSDLTAKYSATLIATGSTLTNFTSEPAVVYEAGVSKTITGTVDEINAELVNAKVTMIEDGSVVLSMAGKTCTVLIDAKTTQETLADEAEDLDPEAAKVLGEDPDTKSKVLLDAKVHQGTTISSTDDTTTSDTLGNRQVFTGDVIDAA